MNKGNSARPPRVPSPRITTKDTTTRVGPSKAKRTGSEKRRG